MGQPSQSYHKRGLLYFDQNLLKEPIEALIQSDSYLAYRQAISIVYSDETLREITRGTGLIDRFVRNLESFDTLRISQVMENFRPTGEYRLIPEAPSQRLKEIEEQNLLADPDLLGLEVLHKFFGGHPSKSFHELFEEQFDALENYLISGVRESGLSAEDENALLSIALAPLKSVRPIFMAQSAQIEASLEEFRTRNSLLLTFRTENKIDIQKLNSITGENIIERIWELAKKSSPAAGQLSIQKFFGMEDPNPLTGLPHTVPEKIRSVMMVLNMLGYKSDGKLSRPGKFAASMSDLGHASWACFCDAFITNDQGLAHRLSATYQFLDIGTHVLKCDTSDGFEFTPAI